MDSPPALLCAGGDRAQRGWGHRPATAPPDGSQFAVLHLPQPLAGLRRRPGRWGIALMNWVSMHSPRSGNERWVMLALTDTCSRDDGTGCFPPVLRIARKARTGERSVPRVIGAGR